MRTALRTALAMSSAEPASVPCSSKQAPSRNVMVLPCSSNEVWSVPTHGMASVTSMKRSCGRSLSASFSTTGSTCTPSTMIPHQALWSSSAAPTTPGSRLASGDMALNRWVKPVSAVVQRGAHQRRRRRWCGRPRPRRPALDQPLDDLQAGRLRRQGHQGAADAERGQQRHASRRRCGAACWRRGCPCGATLRNGPSMCTPEHAGRPGRDRGPRRLDRGARRSPGRR